MLKIWSYFTLWFKWSYFFLAKSKCFAVQETLSLPICIFLRSSRISVLLSESNSSLEEGFVFRIDWLSLFWRYYILQLIVFCFASCIFPVDRVFFNIHCWIFLLRIHRNVWILSDMRYLRWMLSLWWSHVWVGQIFTLTVCCATLSDCLHAIFSFFAGWMWVLT